MAGPVVNKFYKTRRSKLAPTSVEDATGTLTRTTFATGSVTLPQLAERLAALIADLKSINIIK